MADDKIIQHSHYKEDPLPRLEFSNLGYSAWLTKMHQIYQGEDPPEVPASISTSVDAFVNAGRWLWECIACNNATVCEIGQPSICVECATQGWVNVVFPSNREEVEAELLKQPGHRAHAPIRQWRPGWGMSVLEDRTARAQAAVDAGVPFPVSLSIGATRIWSVGEILTAANKNTYERTVLEDLAGRNGPVEYEGPIVIDSLTTTERNAITLTGTGGLGASGNGLVIYNSTKSVFERYENGAWVLFTDLTVLTATGAARGDLVFIDSNGNLKLLPAGTDGHHLRAKGASADPIWEATVIPAGTIHDFAGTTTPAGFLTCDGSAVSRTTYASLFTAIGTTWGTGNGSTTFNVPDLRRYTTIGSAGTQVSGPGTSVGNTGGAETHTLITSELPSHSHPIQFPLYQAGGVGAALSSFQLVNTLNPLTWTTGTTGGGGAHNSMQPSAVVLKIIKT